MFWRRLKDYFIPHEGNNYSPSSLEKVALLGMLCLVVLTFASTNLFSVLWMSSSWLVGTVLPAVVVELTNEERNEGALSSLRRNDVLDEAARLKARHMAEAEYFAHYSPDGVSPWHWFGEVDYNFVHAGENLAVHFTESDAVVEGWMNSPTHRANILNGNYTEIGVGTAQGTYEGFKTVYVVQLFGTPAAAVQPVSKTPTPVVAGEEVSVQKVVKEEQSAPPVEVLAEKVTLTESVVFDAEPVSKKVAVESETHREPEVEMVERVFTTSSTVPSHTVAVTDLGPVLYSDFISTSTGGVPAETISSEVSASTPAYIRLATQPNHMLQYIYGILSVFILLCLVLSISIEVRTQRPVQVFYGVGLLFVMGILLYVQILLTNGVLIV